MQTDTQRNAEIDGIRGWASFVVLFFHFLYGTFEKLVPVFHNDFLGIFFNGHLMVLIFFILSGDALSLAFFRTGDTLKSARVALSRYFRLGFPIVISSLLVFLFMKLGLVFNLQAAKLVHCETWLGLFLDFPPSLKAVLVYAFEGVYFHHSIVTAYNPFLWTMGIELLGSVLVFANIMVLGKARQPAILPILAVQALFFLVFSEYMALFILGMIFGQLRSRGFFDRVRGWKRNWLLLPAAAVVALALIPSIQAKALALFSLLSFHQVATESGLFILAGIIVLLIYGSRQLTGFFGNRFSRFLGELSFPLYVFQFNVLVSLSSWMIVAFGAAGWLEAWWLAIPVASVLVTVLAAWLFRLLEKAYLDALGRRMKLLLEPAAGEK